MTKVEARREVRRRLAEWLRAVGSEPPDDEMPDVVYEEWEEEVRRCADRIERLNP